MTMTVIERAPGSMAEAGSAALAHDLGDSAMVERRQPTVLVFGTDSDRRDQIVSIIEEASWLPLVAGDRSEVLRIVQGAPPDLFVLVLAGFDGVELELLDDVRNSVDGELVPIVCVLDQRHRDLTIDAFGRRADDVVCGRPHPSELIARLRARIERRPVPTTELIEDPVTGALTPRAFATQLSKEHERVARGGEPGALAFLSLDELPGITARRGSRRARRAPCTGGPPHRARRSPARLRRFPSRGARTVASGHPDEGSTGSPRPIGSQDLRPRLLDRRFHHCAHTDPRIHRVDSRRSPSRARRPSVGRDVVSGSSPRPPSDPLGGCDVAEADAAGVAPAPCVRACSYPGPGRGPAAHRAVVPTGVVRVARSARPRHHGSRVPDARRRACDHRSRHPDREQSRDPADGAARPPGRSVAPCFGHHRRLPPQRGRDGARHHRRVPCARLPGPRDHPRLQHAADVAGRGRVGTNRRPGPPLPAAAGARARRPRHRTSTLRWPTYAVTSSASSTPTTTRHRGPSSAPGSGSTTAPTSSRVTA